MAIRIETSHAGSLPRPQHLIDANKARAFKEDGLTLERTPEFDQLVTDAVEELVQQQVDLGITVPGDGEFGKAMSNGIDYGAWWSYIWQRVEGLAVSPEGWGQSELTAPEEDGEVHLTSFENRRDWVRFREAYLDPTDPILKGGTATPFPATVGKLKYVGHDAVASDVRNLRAALDKAGVKDGFITSLSPGSAARITNTYYASDDEHLWAWAEVLREEYRAIVDGGLILQIDDPSVAESWDQVNPEPSLEAYRRFVQKRVDAVNYALEGIDRDRVRYHLCWGSWHGPHTTDLELRHIVDIVLKVNAKYFSFEAANARHEHEWKVWQDIEIPEGIVLVPGVVGHATNVVEHPELVADRIERFARIVGPENVIAATDCGLGGRIHPLIAQAKLEALGEGARLASERF